MTVTASITLDGFAGLKPNQIRTAARVAMQAIGDKWIKDYLPMHFTVYATGRYHYAPRDPAYRRRKRNRGMIRAGASDGVRSIGEDKPLVWSGRSRDLAKGSRTDAHAPSSTRAYADVVIPAPALNFTKRNVNMREEVTTVLPEEMERLSALFVRTFERELERMGKSTRRVLKAA